jgi:hypothetical protein
MAPLAVPFNDLRPRFAADPGGYRAAVERVFARGWYVLGPEVEAFETEFAEHLGGGHAVGVANGTDAIELSLRAAGIGPGDEVITVAHTAVATVCGSERSGARPVFVDIRADDYGGRHAADAGRRRRSPVRPAGPAQGTAIGHRSARVVVD